MPADEGVRLSGPRCGAGLLVLLLCSVLLQPAPASTTGNSVDSAEEEGDQAAFVVAVQRGGGAGRCSGALVSQRAVLTTAWCALGGPGAARAQLWVLAGTRPRKADCIRRVVRVAVAHGARAEEEGPAAWGAWGGAARDLALLELAEAFGEGAHARPVMLAPAAGNCSAALCYTVRGAPRGLLTIETLAAARSACASAAPHWAAVKDTAVCFRGPELCPTEWGAGVVCNGVLCGVVSRSARAAAEGAAWGAGSGGDVAIGAAHAVNADAGVDGVEGEPDEDTSAADCGDTHAVQSVPLWRPFLECAHTMRACGRGQCTRVCSESREVEAGPSSHRALPAAPTTPRAVEIVTDGNTGVGGRRAVVAVSPPAAPRPPPPPRRAPPPERPRPDEQRRAVSVVVLPTLTAPPEPLSPGAPRQRDYEPYRPDFKPGEYGDNVVDYNSVDEDMPPTLAPLPPLPPPAPPRPARPAPRARPPAPRRQPPQLAASVLSDRSAYTATPAADDDADDGAYVQAEGGDAPEPAPGGTELALAAAETAASPALLAAGPRAALAAGDAAADGYLDNSLRAGTSTAAPVAGHSGGPVQAVFEPATEHAGPDPGVESYGGSQAAISSTYLLQISYTFLIYTFLI